LGASREWSLAFGPSHNIERHSESALQRQSIASSGFDYTGADCEGWMKEAGFSQTRVEPLVGPDSMVVGIK